MDTIIYQANMQYSIILTVHNKAGLIEDVLTGIIKNTIGKYELIVIIDGCTDGSYSKIHDLLSRPENRWIDAKIMFANNVFETAANNMGLKTAVGKYCIIVQDDMIIKEHAWNARLAKPVETWPDVFAVTARCAHNWIPNPRSIDVNSETIRNDWCDVLHHVDHANRSNVSRDTFEIRASVNRGPLLLVRSDLEALNYLDEIYSPQDMDDHDLCFRARKQLGKVCGCYWIDFESHDDWGGTRENGQPKLWLLHANQKNMRIFFKRFSEWPRIKESRHVSS